MTRREVVAAPFVIAARRARKTSVVLFMTDDHGAWATGAYGCREVHTPNIDALAAGGVRFTNAFAATPVCSPSRMTYLTGELPATHGVQDWLIPEDSFGATSRDWLAGHTAYSEVLARAGYTMGLCGKWHVGRDGEAHAGFSYWATVPGGGGTYRNPEFVVNGSARRIEGFKTDAVGDFAIDFLNQQKSGHPFYLMVPFYAPHTPYDFQPERYRVPYEGCEFKCFPEPAKPHPWQNEGLRGMFGKRAPKLGYSALVTGADANVGRVLGRLSELRLRDDTLVIFTADQGWNAGHHGVWGKGNGTIPFNLYEESLRVPMIWNHAGRIGRGATVDAMVSSYDFFPTILEYLGVEAPAERRRVGRSYAGFLRGRGPANWRNRLYFEYAHVRGIRTRNLKYIERAEGYPSELFDLEADPGETQSRWDERAYAGQRKALHEELTRYFEGLGAPPIEGWRATTKQRLPAESARR